MSDYSARLDAITARANKPFSTSMEGIAAVDADRDYLLGLVREQAAIIAAVRNELSHAEANGHHLDQSCQGVGFTRPAAVRIDYIRAALGDES